MIRIYKSVFNDDVAESHEFCGRITDFLRSQGVDSKDWMNPHDQRIGIRVNGVTVPYSKWGMTKVKSDDNVELRIIPKGGIVNFIRKVDPLMNFLLKGTDQTNTDTTARQQQNIEESKVKANTPKLNDVIPELLGRYLKYPDYLTPPRRYYLNEKEQWVEFLCCVGPGSYHIDPETVKIGETSFSSLGEFAQYTIFNPGADMSGYAARDIWYTAPEVSGTSSGNAGIDIPAEYTGTSGGDTVASEYTFNGNQITITQPAEGHWAEGMKAGTRITDVTLQLQYDVLRRVQTPGQTDFINRFTGNFQEILPLSIGSPVSPSFPVTGGALIKDMNLDASGNGWIELETTFGADVDQYPTSTQFIAFETGGPHRYEVTAISGKTITVQKFAGSPVSSPVAGWLGFANVSSTSATITADTSSFAGDWTALYSAVPKGYSASNCELDFYFPRGLSRVNSDGSIEPRSVTIDIEYRDQTAGGAFTMTSRTFTSASPDPIGFTTGINVGFGRPEFRVRRQGVASADSNDNEEIEWYGLKSLMMNKNSYPDVTAMFVRVRSGGKISVNAESKVNVIATRILPRMQDDQSFGLPDATQQISASFRHIANSIGYSDEDIDLNELGRLNVIWKTRGDAFNFIFGETTVKDAMNKVLNAGFAELTVDDGRLKPVRDEIRTAYEQSYSLQNTTTPITRSARPHRHDDIDGVEVEFMNGETWVTETIDCLLPGDLGLKKEKITVDGVTDRTRAWRIGMRRRRVAEYRRWDYQFETELDALNSKYWSLVAIVDDIPGYGKSAILQAISAYNGMALLTISEKTGMTAGQTYLVAYRNKDGLMVGPYTAQRGLNDYQIIADFQGAAWPVITLKYEPPHVYWGTAERFVFPALVNEISPSETEKVNVAAVNYTPDVYIDDDNTAPA